MTTAVMNSEFIQEKIFETLEMIAPEAELDNLDPTVDMRDALDIDSFDFLNFLIALDDEFGVEIPEADYGKLISLNDLISYLQARM
jgi:acyl carrier protein